MNINYKLSAVDVLDIFYNIPKKKHMNEKLKLIEENYNIVLPSIFKKFMCSSNGILETADIWDYSEESPFYFLYEWIKITISELTKENTEIDNEYFPFIESPVSEWQNLVDDYMMIGNDYAGCIVYFGIRKKDLNMENPPVYMYHEANNITDWKLLYNSLSEYLSVVVCDAVSCECYHTARRVLKDYGWNYDIHKTNSEEIISKYGIVPDNLKKFSSMYRTSNNDWVSWCYDSEKKVLFIFQNKENNMIIYTIYK
ncbi:MAG: SMI1/KNR4 family protein [Ruminococcus sp.]|nr:SMI1/KNR4 family protein [Ruminococcus sp.]MDE6678764.1 SMI1/KNR4 family protein [Ruminococcus sp.]